MSNLTAKVQADNILTPCAMEIVIIALTSYSTYS